MVHNSLVKMTGQMVFTLIIRNTTLITLDMLKSTCPKWQGIFLAPVQIWFFQPKFIVWKTKNFSSVVFLCLFIIAMLKLPHVLLFSLLYF
jgi:hypothetical protein